MPKSLNPSTISSTKALLDLHWSRDKDPTQAGKENALSDKDLLCYMHLTPVPGKYVTKKLEDRRSHTKNLILREFILSFCPCLPSINKQLF